MAVVLGKHVKIEIEGSDGVRYDVTGDVSGYEINCGDYGIETSFTITGEEVIPAAKMNMVDNWATLGDGWDKPETWRCQYCNQMNEEDVLYCAHCGGDMP